MTVVPEKPSIEEALAHYGVLGMKWGHTRAKANAPQIRKARQRLYNQGMKLQNQRDVVKTAKKSGDVNTLKKEQQRLGDMRASFLKNPDRVIASRMTRGEKAISMLFLPYGTTAVVGTSAISRRIEYKQETGAYNKKR